MLTHEKLFSLEQLSSPPSRVPRQGDRAQEAAHLVPLDRNASLHFEDETTMHYQVQEMIRLERMCEPELIQEELDVYNPLIPDGANWKAMLMLEFPDVEERKRALGAG